MTVRSWRRLRDDGEREESTRAPCLSLGLVLVTASALLFGIVAAFIKAIDVPTLVLQLVHPPLQREVQCSTSVEVAHFSPCATKGINSRL